MAQQKRGKNRQECEKRESLFMVNNFITNMFSLHRTKIFLNQFSFSLFFKAGNEKLTL
jgi:hypothetical protein